MRITVPALGILAALLVAVPTTAQSPGSKRPDDEKAIRQLVDGFVAAYNGHSAAAIAELFTPDGTITDEDGHVTRGREAIAKVFAGALEEHPKTHIEDSIESIRFVGPAEAVENGSTTITHDKETPAETNRYRAVHVKRDGKWQMASAADLPADAWTGEDELKQLEGLIGDWIDESPDALVLTSYRWTDNRRFILGQFTVQIAGKPAMTGTQRIGWDPLKKTIRSWVFDSEGGFAEGTWTLEGNKWVVKLNGVTRDGKTASATHTITQLGKHRMTLQTVDRVVGSQKLPDGEKFLVVRRPPAPKGGPAK